MSLERYINQDEFFVDNRFKYGQSFSNEDMDSIPFRILTPKIINSQDSVISEVHLYTFNSDYLGYSFRTLDLPSSPDSFLAVDVRDVFRAANIERGSFKIAVNLFIPLMGNPLTKIAMVKEISGDSTEIAFEVDDENLLDLNELESYVNALIAEDALNNLTVNFSENRVYKIINFRRDRYNQNRFYVKVYGELEDSIVEKLYAWFGFELADSFVDTIVLTERLPEKITNKIKGPNFRMDADQWDSKNTPYKNWEELLDTDAPTNRLLLDKLFSGSAQATLNIDYTDFNNYIFYSSAKDRLSNYWEKLKAIETYEDNIKTIQEASGSSTPASLGGISQNENRIDTIRNAFDDFERWLHYSPTSSIFTHDVSGSLTTYPKFKDSGKLEPYSYSSSIAQTWFSSSYEYAVDYDRTNYNSLWWSIPEHILMDDANSNYITFVNMVGQHFDILHSYIKALTKIHDKDEHPERGLSNDLLHQVAQSFGWRLQNTRTNSELWKYYFGTDQSGSELTSSGFLVEPYEKQTQQIWRRTLLNLPYILKTKGTNRSLRALMSVYGIPNTLLSIKEYGGAVDNDDRPLMIEDVFTYKLLAESGSHVATDFVEGTNSIFFRFSSIASGSTNEMPLFGMYSGSTYDWKISIEPTSSISGSDEYGIIKVGSNQSEPIPLYSGNGGDLWTIRIQDTGSNIEVKYGKAPDSLYGRVVFTGSFTFTPTNPLISQSSAELHLGSIPTGSGENYFDGFVQGLKTYSTSVGDSIFNEYVRNPGAYYTNEYSSSYYDVIQYYPLGATQIREDRFLTSSVSSSHPNQNIDRPVLNFINFPDTGQASHYESQYETYYIRVPKIGPNVPYSDKIRLEEIRLKYNLDPSMRSTDAEFDDKPVDSRRLAVVFSLADQINRDIYNHVGFQDIDQYIGSVREMYETEYEQLEQVRCEYFKKYQRTNKINDFINILSLYDYTFFEQIKQIVPGRADLIDGILIEPHILERSKVTIINPPEVTENSEEMVLEAFYPTPTGDESSLEGTIPLEPTASMDYNYQTGSIQREILVSGSKNWYRSGSINLETEFSTSVWSKHNGMCTEIEVIDGYTGTVGELDTMVTKSRVNPCYNLKEFLYNSFMVNENLYDNPLWDDIYFDPTQSRMMPDYWYSNEQINSSVGDLSSFNFYVNGIQNSSERFSTRGWILGGSSGEYIFTTQSFDFSGTGSFLLRVYARPNPITSFGYLDLRVNDRKKVSSHYIEIGSGSYGQYPNEYRFKFQAFANEPRPSGSFPESYIEFSCNTGSVVIYSVELFKYTNDYNIDLRKVGNMERGVNVGNILTEVDYQIQECENRNNSRFNGSKISGPDWNVISEEMPDKSPVVEINIVNPNKLNFSGDIEGDLIVE